MDIPHVPVLLDQIIDAFADIAEGVIVDCTVGYGGHSEAILKSNPNIKMICIDQDIEALEFSKRRLEPYSNRITFLKGRFSDVIKNIKDVEDIRAILADIGVSSLQLDKEDRGFGFDSFALDMRMDRDQKISAKDIVNNYEYEDLNRIFRDYGEVRDSKRVASLIVKQREIEPFTSSKQLAEFLSKHLYSKKLHPATLVFQAIRIEVNDELGELKRLLQSIKKLDKDKCLVAIISFHSLEDRVVKNYFKEWTQNCICPKEVFRCVCGNNHSFGKIITKKPIIPTDKEINENPRSRSSKLRLFRIQR